MLFLILELLCIFFKLDNSSETFKEYDNNFGILVHAVILYKNK